MCTLFQLHFFFVFVLEKQSLLYSSLLTESISACKLQKENGHRDGILDKIVFSKAELILCPYNIWNIVKTSYQV